MKTRVQLALAALAAAFVVAIALWLRPAPPGAAHATVLPTKIDDERRTLPSVPSDAIQRETAAPPSPTPQPVAEATARKRRPTTRERPARSLVTGRLVSASSSRESWQHVDARETWLEPAIGETRASVDSEDQGAGFVDAAMFARRAERDGFALVLEDGRFELELLSRREGTGRELGFTSTQHKTSVNERGFVPLPSLLPDALDIGTIELRPSEVLVSGHVVDRAGEPVPYAQFEIHADGPDAESERARQKMPDFRHADAAGAFVIDGWSESPMLRLFVTHPAHQSLEVRGIARGSRDLRIVLEASPKGWIAARWITADPKLSRFVRAELERPLDHWTETEGSDEGRVEFRPLDAGVYRLRLFSWTLGETVLTLEDLVVVDGKPCADPRLDPIDLTKAITNHVVKLVKRDGTAYAFNHVDVEVDGGRKLDLINHGDGELWIPSVGPLPKLSIVTRSGKRIPFVHGAIIVVDD